MKIDDYQQIEIREAQALWDWLTTHHSQLESVWLLTHKKDQGAAYVSRQDVLDALIAFGWIDGRRLKVDAKRTAQLISPRKTQAWAQTYKDRARTIDPARTHAGPWTGRH